MTFLLKNLLVLKIWFSFQLFVPRLPHLETRSKVSHPGQVQADHAEQERRHSTGHNLTVK